MRARTRRPCLTGHRAITWALLLPALCVASVATAPAQGPGGIVQDGARPDFSLLYTGDVIGYIDPCG
jgi:hypothetical protein